MSRKQCRRRVWGLVNPITHAITGAAITDTARLDQVREIEAVAIGAFRDGTPTIDHWKAMADMLNVAETMARDGIGPEVLPACVAVDAALRAGHERYRAHGRIGRAAGEYEAYFELWEYHDLQRSSISRSEYERAIEKTRRRIVNAPADVRVTL